MKSCYRILLLCIVVMLAACAAQTGTRPTTGATLAPEEAVARRAQERWDLLIAKEYGKAYDYLTPGTREVTAKDAYIRKLLMVRVKWQDAKVIRVTCDEPDHCAALVSVNSLVRMPQLKDETLVPSPSNEQWILSGGEWFVLQD